LLGGGQFAQRADVVRDEVRHTAQQPQRGDARRFVPIIGRQVAGVPQQRGQSVGDRAIGVELNAVPLNRVQQSRGRVELPRLVGFPSRSKNLSQDLEQQ